MSIRLIHSSQYLLMGLLVSGCLTSITSYAQQPQQAAQYHQAATAYREAAAKCPPHKSCYLAYANYLDCQANSLKSGSTVQCSEPSCDMSNPPCPGASSGESSVSNAPPATTSSSQSQIDQVNRAMTSVGDTVLGIMESRAKAKEANRRAMEANAEEALNERKSREEAFASEKTQSYARRDSVENSEEDQRAQERAQAYAVAKNSTATQALNAPSSTWGNYSNGAAFPTNASKAAVGCQEWSPWWKLKDATTNTDLVDFDIALWGSCQLEDTGFARAMQWALRNRSSQAVTIYYEVFIVDAPTAQVGNGGWNRYKRTVPAGKIVWGTDSAIQAFLIGAARVISITPAGN